MKKIMKRVLVTMLSLALMLGLLPGMVKTAQAAPVGEGISSLPSASGSYYLTQNISINSTWTVPSGSNITLDLNGHSITMTGNSGGVIKLDGSSVTLTINDSVGTGKITGAKEGTEDGSRKCGGGILVRNNATLIMDGGQISGNKATLGGGIAIISATATLKGNTKIINNTGDVHGGGIYTVGTSSRLYISEHVEITGNTAYADNGTNGHGGGVHNAEGTIFLSGAPIIKNNTASHGTGICVEKLLTIDGPLSGNSGDINIFMNLGGYNGQNRGRFSNASATYINGSIISIFHGDNGTVILDSDSNGNYLMMEGNSVSDWQVTYDANGGTGAPGTATVNKGQSLTLSSTTPTRGNYDFVGWNTKSDGTGTNYSAGASFTPTASTTLFAKWYAYAPLTDANKPTITGDHTPPQVGDELAAGTPATGVTYQWFYDDGSGNPTGDPIGTGTPYTVKPADVGKKIIVVATQDKDEGGNSLSPVRQQNSAPVGPVEKKPGPVAPTNATTAGFVPNYRTETFTVNSDYEVSTNNNNDGTGVISNSSLTTALDGTAKVYIRKKETAEFQPGAWLEVSLTARPAAPTGLTTDNATNNSTADGKIKGTNDTMEYKLKGSTDGWTTAGGTDIAVKPGTYQVRVKATDDVPHGFAAEVTVGSKPSGGGGSGSGGGSYTPSTPSTSAPTTTSAPTAAPAASSAPAPQPTSAPASTSAPVATSEPYTIPVENESTVPVETTITDGTARMNEITQDTINKVTEETETGSGQDKAAKDNTLLLDFSGAKQEVTGVELTKTSVGRLAETTADSKNKVDTVTVRMTNAIVELDSKTLTAVNEQAAGSSIRLVVDGTQLENLNDAQQQAVNNYNSAVTPTTFDAYFESDGNRISDFKGGKAKVSYKYDIPTGFSPYFFHMLFLGLTGETDFFTTTYASGWISGLLSHFSDYAIVYDDTKLNADGILAMDPYSGMDKAEWDMDESDFIDDDTTILPNGATAYANGIAINSELKVYQTKDEITIHWGKVKGATGYKVYAGYCGPKMPDTPIKIIKKGAKVKVKIKKLNGKKLKPKKNYKFCVVAFKTVEGVEKVLGRTVTAHIVGKKNKKYSNLKKLTLAKTKSALSMDKTFKIKAKVTLVDKTKKSLSDKHAPMFRYASTNKAVATVDKNGKVTAVGKGTCYIWVYAKNGYGKKVKITVK